MTRLVGRNLVAAVSLLVAALGLASGGCCMVESVHPLSDEKTSAPDDRLVGTWQGVSPSAEKEGKPASPDEKPITIRKVDGLNQYQAESPDDPDSLVFMWPTRIGDRHYLSIKNLKADPPHEVAYLLVHYRFVGNDQWHAFLLDPDRVAAAIGQDQLQGEIARDEPGDDPNQPRRLQQVRLTTPTPKLREVLASAEGAQLFNTDEPVLIFRRVAK
jgi:hypothetical protein